MNKFLNVGRKTLAIDPGSESLRIAAADKIIFNEPAEISIDIAKGKASGFGISKVEGDGHVVIRPTRYAVADFQAFEMMLRAAISQGMPKSWFPPAYRMFIGFPTDVNEVEKRAYRDSAEHAGAVEVYLILQSNAAAVGLNILHEKKNFILVDFSASKFEVSIYINSIMIAVEVLRIGTRDIFTLLKNLLRRSFQLVVDDKEIIHMMQTAYRNQEFSRVTIQRTELPLEPVREIIDAYLLMVNDKIMTAIEYASSRGDMRPVLENGIYLTGGGSTIEFLVQQIGFDHRIKKHFSQTPTLDCITGLMKIAANRNSYKDIISY